MSPPSCCRFCGSEDLERSDNKGELLCCRCGAVLEESAIVEGLQFAEASNGGMVMVGRFVPSGSGSRCGGFGSSDTREQALQRGYSNIQTIADHLRLSSQHVSSAHRLYLMATQRNFTIGRKGVLVASACLYAICRRERTPHLLIDFSDILRVSVRSLGQVFMKLLRVLHVQVPQIDPSLYMERFAAQIPFGDKARLIAQTGVRLIQAMTRDWISTGRRPMGLCGAALLIAARCHNIQINAEDIAQVVRVSTPTLNKRLSEFKRTATAQLPASELEETDLLALPAMSMPPCLRKKNTSLSLNGSQISHRMQCSRSVSSVGGCPALTFIDCGRSGENDLCPSVAEDEEDFLSHIHEPLAVGGAEIRSSQGEIQVGMHNDAICDEAPSSSAILRLAGRLVNAIGSLSDGDGKFGRGSSFAVTGLTDNLLIEDVQRKGAAVRRNQYEDEDTEESLVDLLQSMKNKSGNLLPPDVSAGSFKAGSDEDSRRQFDYSPLVGLTHNESQDPSEHGVSNLQVFNGRTDGLNYQNGTNNGDADEEAAEVEAMLLTNEERIAKALIWDDLTKDVMPEVHRRLRRRRQRENELEKDPNRRKKEQRRRILSIGSAGSAVESVRMALQKSGRSLVQRLDDDALDALFSSRKIVDLPSEFPI